MKKMFAALGALTLSAGAFAAGAANPTNEAKIAPAQPAHGTESAYTTPERGSARYMGSNTTQAHTPYGEVSSIHTNEGTIVMQSPAPLPVPGQIGMEQSNELKIAPAAPAHGPAAASPGR